MAVPFARELVLLGGGHTHVLLLRMLGMDPVPGLRVVLVSPDDRTPYSGMLPGHVAGHYTEDDIHIDLGPLCRFAGADFVQARAVGIDPDARTVRLAGRPNLRYDLLSIDIGSTPSLTDLPSPAGVIPVKPISGFLARWSAFLDRLDDSQPQEIGFVGGGAGGVELCLAVHHFMSTRHPDAAFRFHLFTDRKTILGEFDARVRIIVEKLLAAKNIQVHRDFHATGHGEGQLESSDGRIVSLNEVFWITSASSQPWLAESGLSVDEDGFIKVRDTLQSVSHPDIFAVGDCATMINHPRPRAGVFAVRQGKPLWQNIRACLLGDEPKPFRPQSRFLSLLSTGPKHAVASRNGFSVAGRWVWQWKDRIDRRFMARFAELPQMQIRPANSLMAEFDDQMHCGGCGSKVSSDLLGEVLQELLGRNTPVEDAARIEIPDGMTLLQSVDHFRSFIPDPYLQARIAVCHALSDIYACGGTPHSVQAMLTLPFGKPAVIRSLLEQIMQGTLDQLSEEGADLVGGHTSEGLEMSIGFAANGFVSRQGWRKQGLATGDCLILTKPLGTGTLLAADMQFRARGRWVSAAIDSMLVSNRRAVAAASGFDISACTDVTGFGLANHCLEMLRPDQGASLDIASVPVLEGAFSCLLEQGILSTLHTANRQAAALTLLTPEAEILFDPQTAGGLLIGVPFTQAQDCVQALVTAGYGQAAIVGTVTSEPGIRLQ